MGTTFAEIKLVNTFDELKARDGIITKKEIKQVTASALVDTGAGTLVMPEDVCKQLGLEIIGKKTATVAGGARVMCKKAGPVTIYCQGRDCTCNAWVMPGEKNVILGVIPLEDMDFVVNPVKQCLEGAHGDEWTIMVI